MMQGVINNRVAPAPASNRATSKFQQQRDISQGHESQPMQESRVGTANILIAKDGELSCSTYLAQVRVIPEGIAEKVVRLARKHEDIQTCRKGCFIKFMKDVPRTPLQKWIWELEQLGLDLLADNLKADPTLAEYVPHEFIEVLKHRNPTCLAPLERALLVITFWNFKENVGLADIDTYRARLWIWLGKMLRGGVA
jgi:hypothetical protein